MSLVAWARISRAANGPARWTPGNCERRTMETLALGVKDETNRCTRHNPPLSRLRLRNRHRLQGACLVGDHLQIGLVQDGLSVSQERQLSQRHERCRSGNRHSALLSFQIYEFTASDLDSSGCARPREIANDSFRMACSLGDATEMSGRMLRVAPDQPAKRRRLRISYLSGDLLNRQPRGLEQKARDLQPDLLHELDR
jgi:hypothetical protein